MPTPPPRPVHVTPASTLVPSGGQTSGMTRLNAITSLSPTLCSTLMRAAPHSSSAVHHHGAQDTIIYAVSGVGSVVSEGGKKRQELRAGDFALIPAWVEHQEINEGGEEVVWVICRSGGTPVVVNLEGWGGGEVE